MPTSTATMAACSHDPLALLAARLVLEVGKQRGAGASAVAAAAAAAQDTHESDIKGQCVE